jgi:uncharacterized membrane protein
MATTVTQSTALYEVQIAQPLQPAKPARKRIDSVDLLRGIVMVVMMLDHTRDFVHNAALQFDPLDPTRTNVALFFTRWITHFCAPTFVFLAGTAAYLYAVRGKTKRELSRFLITRGLWLIVLELTVVRLLVFFNLDLQFLGFLQVIWVIGASMIVLAGLIYLPLSAIAVFGLAMIFLHNFLDWIPALRVNGFQGPGTDVPWLDKLLIILHQPGMFHIAGVNSPLLFALYPLIPWIGVMAAGYVFGSLYQLDPRRRRRLLFIIGSSAMALFVIVRAINIYGDPQPWTSQKNFLYTVLSFLNTQKYPPSLLFLLMTLGPSITALGFFESINLSAAAEGVLGKLRQILVTFGRVPLFFYLLQWLVAHSLAVLLHWAFGKPVKWLFVQPIGQAPDPGIGFNLFVVYLVWITGVVLLYPLCKWFAGVKQRRRDWWLSYL